MTKSPNTAGEVEAAQPVGAVAALLAWVERHRFYLFGGLVLLYLAAFNGQWRIGDDSAGYVNIALSILNGGGLEDHEESMHRYPGVPWLIATAFRIGGHEAFWLADLFILLIAGATLALFHRTIRLHDGRPVAVLVTVMLGVTLHFFRHAYELLADLPFLFGVMLFLCGYEGLIVRAGRVARRIALTRHDLLDIGMVLAGLGVMVVTRRTMIVFILALLAVCVWHLVRQTSVRKRMVFAALLVGAVTIGGLWVLFDPRGGPAAYSRDLMLPLLQRHGAGESLKRFAGYGLQILEGDAAEAAFGLDLGPGLNTLGGIIVIALGIALVRRRMLWGVFIAALIIAMIIHMPDVRYFVPILPLMVYGWWRAARALAERVDPARAGLVLTIALGLWIAPNLVRTCRFIYEQRQTPFLEHYNDGKYVSLAKVAEHLKATLPADAVVLADASSVLNYYSGYKVANWKMLNRWHRTNPGQLETLRQSPDRIYMIAPMRRALEVRMRTELSVEPGPVLETITFRSYTWTLHKAQPIAAGSAIPLEHAVDDLPDPDE